MGNCCGRESGEEGASFLPRPSNFKGQGRTLGSSAVPSAATAPAPASPSQPSSSSPNPTTDIESETPAGGESAAQRREKMLQAVKNREPKGSGVLSKNLAKQRAQGMDGARREDAAETVRHREMDEQQRILSGE